MVSEVDGIAQLLWHLFDGECHEGGIRLRDPGTDLHPLALNQFSLHAYFFNSMMHRFTAGGIALGEGKLKEKKTREFCMIFYICTVLLNTYLLKFYLHKGKPLLTIPDRLMNNDHSTFLVRDSFSQLVSLL